ncbi:uncharacterized protein LOC135707823 [Ochlerotatus camptorhynchus]|uniref:uncharacterized protein LOC135707823 n=1 Tax=Ochlerotatus camptorhynchus TaxID=644619 RepID=UPI0031DA04B0
MFQIIKTGHSKTQQQPQLHYVDFLRKDCSSPPPLVLSAAAYTHMSAGGKRQFVKVNEEMFVNEIKKRPILYNTTLKDYKKITTRHEAWAEVALAMNLSESECKKRWRSLRDAFMKVVRNKNEDERKTWLHYRLLEFLLPYLGNRTRRQSRTVGMMDGFDNDEDTEYVEIEEDMDIFEESREPITVSYVTEDGKEVFQMLQDPDTIPEGAVIGIEETEDEGEDDDDMFPNMQHSQEITPNENLHSQDNHAGSFMYEERLDSTMLELQETFESTQQPSFAESRGEDIKQEALSDADGSEIHVEEIEMDSLISDQHEDYHTDTQSEAQHLMESMAPSIRAPSPSEDLIEPIQVKTSTAPTVELPSVPQATSNSVLSQPAGEPEVAPVHISAAPTPSLPQREEPPSFEQRESDHKSSFSSCMDSDERFLLSCAPILRRLPNKKNQLARLRIQQLLFELEYDEKYSS